MGIVQSTKSKIIIFSILGACLLWVAYLGRNVISPFLFAIIFAYLLDPVVTFLEHRARFPRPAAILIVYICIILILVVTGVFVGDRLISETKGFAHDARLMLTEVETNNSNLPSWIIPYVGDISQTLRSSINFSSQQIVKLFSGAFSSIFNFFIFLVGLFYFLREGRKFMGIMELSIPSSSRTHFSMVLKKVNAVLSNYLLAQFSLVVFMSAVCSITFALLGVRYALILGIIAGLAELLPIIGAAITFVSIVFVTIAGGGSSPVVVGITYILINQIENILIVPQVTGRMVKLHPLVIMLSVLLGGEIFGPIGFLIAVPFVASLKVVVEHIFAL